MTKSSASAFAAWLLKVWLVNVPIGSGIAPFSMSEQLSTLRQPPAPSPAQEGFVPIDQLAPKEVLPAAPLVIAAYSVAWIAIFAYVVTIWKRLASVEKEMAALSQRIAGGGRR